MRIEDKIDKANYMASDSEVEMLAAARFTNDEATRKVDGTYFRILVANLQSKAGAMRARKPTAKDIEQYRVLLAEVHAPYYAAVLRGVTTPDIADMEGLSKEEKRDRALERNRRSNFARSAVSTLGTFIKLGGDVRGLKVSEVRKMDLQRWIADHPEKAPATVIEDALKRLESQAAAYLETDGDAGRAAVEDCIARLQKLLDDEPEVEAKPSAPRARGPTTNGGRVQAH